MKLLLFLSFISFKLVFCDEIKTENDVLVLTKGNFDEAVASYKYLLVEFYAPWCTHCKSLAPEYAKAAMILKEESPDIRFAKVDATVENELAKRYNIEGYPTIFFFTNGEHKEYDGGRTKDEIIDWLNKKTGPSAVTINLISNCEEFINSSDISVIGFFSNVESKEAKDFLNVASNSYDIPYGITSDFDVFDHYNVINNEIVLFNNYDGIREGLKEDLTYERIKRFIDVNILPTVVEIDIQTVSTMFRGPIKDQCYLLIDKSSNNYEKIIMAFEEAALDFKGKVLFLFADANLEINTNVLDFLIVERDEVPQIRFMKVSDTFIEKFKYTSEEFYAESIKKFVKGVIRGQIKKFMKSEELPEDWNEEPVKVLVAKNFNEIVFDKSKDVLVEFYAPWCSHCQQLAPIYEQLADLYIDTPNLIIAKINGDANDIEGIYIPHYPLIRLYKKETNEEIEFLGDQNLEELSKFVDSREASVKPILNENETTKDEL